MDLDGLSTAAGATPMSKNQKKSGRNMEGGAILGWQLT